MKATGIVRRIDDLGRIVIPKEIRKTMHIRDGDPMEIYTDSQGGVVFRKYSLMGTLEDFALQFCEILSRTTGALAIITDRDTCLAVAGGARRELTDQRLSPALEELMEDRRSYRYTDQGNLIPVSPESGRYFLSCASPILSAGDVLGCVLLAAGPEDLTPSAPACTAVEVVSAFLGRHLES